MGTSAPATLVFFYLLHVRMKVAARCFESAINSSYVFTGIDKDQLGEFRSFIDFASDSPPARLHEIIRGDARELMSYIHEKSVEYDPEPKVLYICCSKLDYRFHNPPRSSVYRWQDRRVPLPSCRIVPSRRSRRWLTRS